MLLNGGKYAMNGTSSDQYINTSFPTDVIFDGAEFNPTYRSLYLPIPRLHPGVARIFDKLFCLMLSLQRNGNGVKHSLFPVLPQSGTIVSGVQTRKPDI